MFWKSINQWVCYNDNQLSIFFSKIRHLINRRFSCFFESINSFTFEWFLQYSFFWNVETSFDKIKIKITYIKSSNQQIIIQNFKQNFRFLNLLHFQHDSKIHVSFRFVYFNVCLFQRHSMNSLQQLINLLQWNFNESIKRISKRMRSIFYIFAININENEFFTHDTKTNNMKKWKTTINVNLSRNQFNSFLIHIFVCLFICRQHVLFRIFAINQNASINKNSKNSNSKNLKQHTFAKSISFCCFDFCFCFCFVLKYRSFHYINLQIFSRTKFLTKFSFSSSHIFSVFVFAFFVFAFIFLRLSYLFWNFQRQSRSNKYLNYRR